MSGLLLYRSQQQQEQSASLGKGIEAYDFSTPKAAMTSRIKIELNGDLRASLELDRLLHRRKWEEELKTIEVSDQFEYGGRVLVLYSVSEDGMKKHRSTWMEKDAMSGFWHISNTYIGPSIQPPGSNVPEEPVFRKMREWHEKNIK